MKIKFWKNTKEDNNVNVKDVTGNPILDLTGPLREGTSVINPEIVIESDTKILTCNYCYIEEFSRYYFIKDIQPLTNRLWKLSLSVDVCYTYRDYIYSQTGFIERNESYFNPNIEDKERDMLFPESFTIVPCCQYQRDGAIIDKWEVKKNQNIAVSFATAYGTGKYGEANDPIYAVDNSVKSPNSAFRDIDKLAIPDYISVPVIPIELATFGYSPETTFWNLISITKDNQEFPIITLLYFPSISRQMSIPRYLPSLK